MFPNQFLGKSIEWFINYDRTKKQADKQRLNFIYQDTVVQGYNARKVISEVYASFVLQCTVSGR